MEGVEVGVKCETGVGGGGEGTLAKMEGVEVEVKSETEEGGGGEVSLAVATESDVMEMKGEAVGVMCELVDGGREVGVEVGVEKQCEVESKVEGQYVEHMNTVEDKVDGVNVRNKGEQGDTDIRGREVEGDMGNLMDPAGMESGNQGVIGTEDENGDMGRVAQDEPSWEWG